MRALPERAVHRPFERGPYRMSMDLVSVQAASWFELDQLYLTEMAERRQLLATPRSAVFAALPASAAARTEALQVVLAALTDHHGDWFGFDGTGVRNRLTNEAWNI